MDNDAVMAMLVTLRNSRTANPAGSPGDVPEPITPQPVLRPPWEVTAPSPFTNPCPDYSCPRALLPEWMATTSFGSAGNNPFDSDNPVAATTPLAARALFQDADPQNMVRQSFEIQSTATLSLTLTHILTLTSAFTITLTHALTLAVTLSLILAITLSLILSVYLALTRAHTLALTLNDVGFLYHEHGLRSMAMDGSHVAVIHLSLYAHDFDECRRHSRPHSHSRLHSRRHYQTTDYSL